MRELVNLHIESLVLEGIPEADRNPVAEALRLELGRLMGEGGIPPGLLERGTIPAIDGGAYAVQGARPEATGAAIAQAIYNGMKSRS